jgi:hypothetical protein
MKISPMAAGGTPGTVLGNIEIGRTADASKMERAKAIARGEAPAQPQTEHIPQVERPSTRTIKMRTNFSTDRDLEALAAGEVNAPDGANPPQSSTAPANEAGTVEATQPLSPQLAAIARAKRALQLERAEFEKQKAAMDAKSPKDGEFVPIDRLKSQPLSVLQELGVTYEQLTQAVLEGQGGSSPEIHALEQKIRALEEKTEKTLSERDKGQKDAALGEMKREAEKLSFSGDDFEMIRETRSVPKVMELIERTYDESGEVLDVYEAMKEIEGELIKDAQRLAALKKIRGESSTPHAGQAPQRQFRTLTASGSTQAPLTARQRALMAFQGTLKR